MTETRTLRNIAAEPLMNIQWIDAEDLRANHYNPNVVHRAELKLLEHSILKTGWVQPVLITPDKVIIDGFHRWMLSRDSTALRARYDGRVPCAILNITPQEAIMLTVRINRAKGTHVALRMHGLVRELIDRYGMTREQIAEGIGAQVDEVDLLYQENVFIERGLSDVPYSRAWVPVSVPYGTEVPGPGDDIEVERGEDDDAS